MRSAPESMFAVAAVLMLGSSAGLAQPAPAAQTSAQTEDIDDPKVARRLRTRLACPPVVPCPGATGHPPSAGRPDGGAAAAEPLRGPVRVAQAETAPSTGSRAPDAALAERSDAAPKVSRSERPRRVPNVKLGFRRFSFVRVGAAETAAATEPFNNLLLDFYPVSTYLRVGLTTQYGWESGTWRSSGDYLIAQSLSLGIQIPGRRVTPFLDGYAGGGYMKRRQFDTTVPTAYWQLGVDVGAEIFLARQLFVSLAFGYLRAVNGFLSQDSMASVYTNAWTLKLGFGL